MHNIYIYKRKVTSTSETNKNQGLNTREIYTEHMP